MKALYSIALLVLSNCFMTLAWYGNLKFFTKENSSLAIWAVILISWGLAFFEYCFQVPANKMGFDANGGPFSLLQLKVIQEVISLIVFVGFSMVFFKSTQFTMNHFIGFIFLVLAVYFIFKN
jgi:uncharacterized protein (DUF486 family)